MQEKSGEGNGSRGDGEVEALLQGHSWLTWLMPLSPDLKTMSCSGVRGIWKSAHQSIMMPRSFTPFLLNAGHCFSSAEMTIKLS